MNLRPLDPQATPEPCLHGHIQALKCDNGPVTSVIVRPCAGL
jgi:hypothetical protein